MDGEYWQIVSGSSSRRPQVPNIRGICLRRTGEPPVFWSRRGLPRSPGTGFYRREVLGTSGVSTVPSPLGITESSGLPFGPGVRSTLPVPI